MASGNDQTIHEIFADNDSENEDEFEGFDPEDIYIDLHNENGRTDLFDPEQWVISLRLGFRRNFLSVLHPRLNNGV